jgi:hypothetical protein
MVLSFKASTFVYRFDDAGRYPRVVSDDAGCEFATDCETLYACTMFDGDATVQVSVIPVHPHNVR